MSFPRIRGGDPDDSARLKRGHILFPAYAGVILLPRDSNAVCNTFPRIRGGDPEENVPGMIRSTLFPAYAGVIPLDDFFIACSLSFPRIRGGDPYTDDADKEYVAFSPHTRG